MARRSLALRRAHRRLVKARQDVLLAVAGWRSGDGVNPENIVWIFGSGRSGSTWLRSMMGETSGHRVWEEPMVGRLFGEFYARAARENLRSPDFIMGDPIRSGWTNSIRNFVLDGARYSNPLLAADEFLIVKEPNGSIGAPLLLEALPESRMILLVRDPRDVVASVLDAAREGGWLRGSRDGRAPGRRRAADRKPNAFVRQRARVYRRGLENAMLAYDAHGGRKVMIRYEDLRADTLGTMRRVYAELGMQVHQKELSRAVEKHSWERIPEAEKGAGKVYRKGSPGGWREDLTPEQASIVEKVTAPLIERFYS
jgi:hypothetical protein